MYKWPRCGHSKRICIFYYVADMQIRIRKSSLALSDKLISGIFNYSATKPFIFSQEELPEAPSMTSGPK